VAVQRPGEFSNANSRQCWTVGGILELIGSQGSESPEAVPKVRKIGIPPQNCLYIACKPTEQTAYLRVCSEAGGNPLQEESGCSCDVEDNMCEVINEFRAR
jgi:hypothetical protein